MCIDTIVRSRSVINFCYRSFINSRYAAVCYTNALPSAFTYTAVKYFNSLSSFGCPPLSLNQLFLNVSFLISVDIHLLHYHFVFFLTLYLCSPLLLLIFLTHLLLLYRIYLLRDTYAYIRICSYFIYVYVQH